MSLLTDEYLEVNTLAILINHAEHLDTVELDTGDFSSEYHKEVYKILNKLKRDGKEISLSALYVPMKEKGLEIQELACNFDTSATTDSHLPEFTKRLRDLRIKRELQYAIDEGEDPSDIIKKAKILEEKIQVESPISLLETFSEFKEHYEEVKETGHLGLVTGFTELDDICPMTKGAMITLAARPGIGKSAMALTIARNLAEYGQRVLFISLEMSRVEIMARLLSLVSGVDSKRIKSGDADETVNQGEQLLERLDKNLILTYNPRLTSFEACRMAYKLHKQQRIDLVVIDYLQLMSDKTKENNNLRVANMSRNFKVLAGECNNTVLALSQVNRQSTGMTSGRPTMSQLRDSGAIEQDSDMVWILHRDMDEDIGRPQTTVAKLHIDKNRAGRNNVAVDFKFVPETTEYKENSYKQRMADNANQIFQGEIVDDDDL